MGYYLPIRDYKGEQYRQRLQRKTHRSIEKVTRPSSILPVYREYSLRTFAYKGKFARKKSHRPPVKSQSKSMLEKRLNGEKLVLKKGKRIHIVV